MKKNIPVLAPLALRSLVDERLGVLQSVRIDGVSLEVASNLLPWYARFKRGLFLHMYLHSASQKLFADAASVKHLHFDCRKRGETRILPLVLDLTNPTPALGCENDERDSFLRRGPVDMILALVHHLAISNNVPLERIAEMLAGLSRYLRFLDTSVVPGSHRTLYALESKSDPRTG